MQHDSLSHDEGTEYLTALAELKLGLPSHKCLLGLHFSLRLRLLTNAGCGFVQNFKVGQLGIKHAFSPSALSESSIEARLAEWLLRRIKLVQTHKFVGPSGAIAHGW